MRNIFTVVKNTTFNAGPVTVEQVLDVPSAFTTSAAAKNAFFYATLSADQQLLLVSSTVDGFTQTVAQLASTVTHAPSGITAVRTDLALAYGNYINGTGATALIVVCFTANASGGQATSGISLVGGFSANVSLGGLTGDGILQGTVSAIVNDGDDYDLLNTADPGPANNIVSHAQFALSLV